MDRAEYEKLHRLEEHMWWFQGLHKNLLTTIASFDLPVGAQVLDAGCGTGGLLAAANRERFGYTWLGLEISPLACGLAREKSGALIVAGSVNQIPLTDRACDIILSADVLCHEGVDEEKALAEFYRILRPGGRLILNLPAYDWMLSAHDRQVANARRYSPSRIKSLLLAAGFQNSRLKYWNSILFPLMLLRRMIWRRKSAGSDVMAFPKILDLCFRITLNIERRLHRTGFNLPFGGSILAVAEKEQ